MLHARRFVLSLCAVVAFGFCVHALAANNPRTYLNATGTARYCAPQKGMVLGLQCDSPVRCAYGRQLSDGGTQRTSDAGAPMVTAAEDEVWFFPADSKRIKLGPAEQCLACVSTDGGSGGDAGWCSFKLDTASP